MNLISGDSSKLQQLSLVTVENPYYTCLGDYNPEKDDSVPVKKNSNLEVSLLMYCIIITLL